MMPEWPFSSSKKLAIVKLVDDSHSLLCIPFSEAVNCVASHPRMLGKLGRLVTQSYGKRTCQLNHPAGSFRIRPWRLPRVEKCF